MGQDWVRRFLLVSRLFCARAVLMSELSLVKFADEKKLLGESTCLKICGNLRRVSFHSDIIHVGLLPNAMVLYISRYHLLLCYSFTMDLSDPFLARSVNGSQAGCWL